jgi:AbrB family looped-hinge helix DNA binding protein
VGKADALTGFASELDKIQNCTYNRNMNLQTFYIKTLDRGLITIPSKIREKLSLSKGSLLKIHTDGTRIIVESATEKKAPYRTYTSAEIDEFLAHDQTSA